MRGCSLVFLAAVYGGYFSRPIGRRPTPTQDVILIKFSVPGRIRGGLGPLPIFLYDPNMLGRRTVSCKVWLCNRFVVELTSLAADKTISDRSRPLGI
jgi:hypothetical protein